jgi:hypothetical protein
VPWGLPRPRSGRGRVFDRSSNGSKRPSRLTHTLIGRVLSLAKATSIPA